MGFLFLLPQGWVASHSTELRDDFCQWDNAWLLSQDRILQPTDPGLFFSPLHLDLLALISQRNRVFPHPLHHGNVSWEGLRRLLRAGLFLTVGEVNPRRSFGGLPGWAFKASQDLFQCSWWHFPYLLPGFSWLQTVALIPSYVSWNSKDKFCSLVFLSTLQVNVILP